MADVIATLTGFIDKAKEERKYSESSVRGLKAAVKVFEPHLKGSELSSLDAIYDNIDNIVIDIYAKHKNDNMSSVTLLVYKRRISKLIRDYRKFGRSPARMAEWNPRRPAAELKLKPAVDAIQPVEAEISSEIGVGLRGPPQSTVNTSDFSLRPDVQCLIALPADLTTQEADRIKGFIDLMAGQAR